MERYSDHPMDLADASLVVAIATLRSTCCLERRAQLATASPFILAAERLLDFAFVIADCCGPFRLKSPLARFLVSP
jgi:hypothetical protein